MTGVPLPLFDIESDWKPPHPSLLPSWRDAKRIGIDIEARDESLHRLGPGVRRPGSYAVGVAFAIEDGPTHYLPVRHGAGDNMDPAVVWRYLRDQARSFTGTVVGHNLQYDLDWLAQNGVEFPRAAWFRDTLIADPLIYELHKRYDLGSIATRYNMPGKHEEHLRRAAEQWGFNPKSELWKLPARHVGRYAEQDAWLPLRILRRQERELEDNGLWEIYDLESQVIPVILRMTRRGIRIDEERLTRVEDWTYREEAKALVVVKRETGVQMRPGTRRDPTGEVWKAAVCAQVVIKLGHQVPLTPVTHKPSIDNHLLKSARHPATDALLRARKINKLRTTFCNGLRAHMVGGRVHCTINQLKRNREDGSGVKGARSGRLSIDHPMLHQIPGERDVELAKQIRSCFLPEEGMLWFGPDYSQQEVRMAVHFAYAARCRGARQAVEQYHSDPKMDFHDWMAKVTGLDRRPAKDNFFGVLYGMGSARLCRELGLPTKWVESRRTGDMIEVAGDEGQAIIDQFDAVLPWARELSDRCKRVAAQRGYIVTLGGRHIHFPPLSEEDGFDWTHKALNNLIQGSSADQVKKAMVELDREGVFLQLQEHDELDGSGYTVQDAVKWGEIMRDTVKLAVPVKVDVEVGPSWGEVEKVQVLA